MIIAWCSRWRRSVLHYAVALLTLNSCGAGGFGLIAFLLVSDVVFSGAISAGAGLRSEAALSDQAWGSQH